MKGNSLFRRYWQVLDRRSTGGARVGGGVALTAFGHPDLLCRRQAGGSGSVCHQWSQLCAAPGRRPAVDFGVAYTRAPTVSCRHQPPYTEESAGPLPSGVVIVPSRTSLRLKEGDKVSAMTAPPMRSRICVCGRSRKPLPAYDQTRASELELA